MANYNTKAAVLCYGIHECDTEATFLVCNMRGGTFDVSILEIFEGVIEVKRWLVITA